MPRPLPDPLSKKLNVGCGHDRREGYLNVDLHAVHKPDLIADVTDLPMLPSGWFEEVLAQDVLEHFERARTAPALAEWSRLLAPQGILHVRVPSLFGMFELLAAPERRGAAQAEEIVHLMYGTQAYTGDYHLAGFTAAILDTYLRRAGLLVCEASIHDAWLFDVRARKCDHLVDDGEFLHFAYFAILGRPIDPGGLAARRDALSSGRATREDIQAALRDSDEARFLARNPGYLLPHANRLGAPPLRESVASTLRSIVRVLRNRLRSG